MQAIALTTRQILHKFLLIRTFEVEATDIGARGHLIAADPNDIEAVRHFFPDSFRTV